jgi:muramoyltetrapeptide carboxypeptidase
LLVFALDTSLSSTCDMPLPVKPPALRLGDSVRIISLASPVDEIRLERGCAELARIGYEVKVDPARVLARDGFFAGPKSDRVQALKQAFCETDSRAILCARGGYGSNYLLRALDDLRASPKILCGFSDITSLQVFLWRTFGWVTFYGPMVGSGFDCGADSPGGYDGESFTRALTETEKSWTIDLRGESLAPGVAEGILLGGCLTLVQTSLGTAWEPHTNGAILILEDRDMKPYQVDRVLMHLKQAGKFDGLAAAILGEFPGCDAPPGTETVKDVARRILGSLEIPVVWGAAIGHTDRPMLTLPLGVRARLTTQETARLEFLEPAVI